MMLYAILSTDVTDSTPIRATARQPHLARLKDLRKDGRLVLAGPHPAIDSAVPGMAGFTGSLVIAEFDSLEKATTWANADPYLKAGVYSQVIVKPFKHVLP